MGEDISRGGSEIYLHGEQEPFRPVRGDAELIDAVSAHVQQHIGAVEIVYHELVSDAVHVDIHVVPAGDGRPFHTLVTSGMSQVPMNIPPAAPEFLRYAELMLCLPPDWQLDREAFGDENVFWPIRMLKDLARYPHKHNTWLGYGHTIPNGDPPKQFAENTRMTCSLICDPKRFGPEFDLLEVGNDSGVVFYAAMPLHEDELALKLESGMDALAAALREHGVDELVAPSRPSVAPPR